MWGPLSSFPSGFISGSSFSGGKDDETSGGSSSSSSSSSSLFQRQRQLRQQPQRREKGAETVVANSSSSSSSSSGAPNGAARPPPTTTTSAPSALVSKHQPFVFAARATTTFLSISLATRRDVATRRRNRQQSANEPFSNDPNRRATDVLLLSLISGYSLQLLTRQKATAAFAKVNADVANGQYYRLITSAFLHGGLLHLFVNAYSLNAIGSTVERIFGRSHVYAAFAASAVSGNIMSYKMSQYPAVGASGAIFGLAGAFAVYLYRHKDVLGVGAEEQLNALGTSLAINAVYGATSARIDNWAHFGGLVGGCVYSYLFGPNFKRDNLGRMKNRPIIDLR